MVYGRSQGARIIRRRKRKTYAKAKNYALRVIGKTKEMERSCWVEELETQDAKGKEKVFKIA